MQISRHSTFLFDVALIIIRECVRLFKLKIETPFKYARATTANDLLSILISISRGLLTLLNCFKTPNPWRFRHQANKKKTSENRNSIMRKAWAVGNKNYYEIFVSGGKSLLSICINKGAVSQSKIIISLSELLICIYNAFRLSLLPSLNTKNNRINHGAASKVL